LSIRLPNKTPSKTLRQPLTLEQAKLEIAALEKKRAPFAKPKALTASERLKQYNSVLSKIDPLKILKIVPNPTFTLTPAAPRSADGKGAIGLVTRDDTESCYWDTDPKFSETGIIQMPNWSEGYIFLTFQTVVGCDYALELSLTMGSIPPNPNISGTWRIYGPNLTLYVTGSPAGQTMVTGFKATDEKSMVILEFAPNYDPTSIFGGARFLSCKLTQL
jgi:hypothetical protein